MKLGINLWSQASDWPTYLAAGRRADDLGYDTLWTWDHIYAIFGDPHQPIFEGYTALAARVLAALKSEHHIKALNRVFGTLFVAAGALLAGFKRTA